MPTGPLRLRVATVNCLHGLDLGGGAGVPGPPAQDAGGERAPQRPPVPGRATLDRLADRLGALDADVVALQEVDRALGRSARLHQVEHLGRRLGMHAWFAPALLGDPDDRWIPVPGRDPGGPGYGVGLLCRPDVLVPGPAGGLRATTRRLPGGGAGSRSGRSAGGPTASAAGWDREPRVALRVDLPTRAGTVAVTVTHLSYLPWRGVRQLRVAAAHATPQPRTTAADAHAAVLLGDLNLPAWVVDRTLAGWRHRGGGRTYPAHEPRLQVDHLLTRGAVAVRDITVGADLGSDHLPLVATVVIDPAPGGAFVGGGMVGGA